jgi:hypothetical protein
MKVHTLGLMKGPMLLSMMVDHGRSSTPFRSANSFFADVSSFLCSRHDWGGYRFQPVAEIHLKFTLCHHSTTQADAPDDTQGVTALRGGAAAKAKLSLTDMPDDEDENAYCVPGVLRAGAQTVDFESDVCQAS